MRLHPIIRAAAFGFLLILSFSQTTAYAASRTSTTLLVTHPRAAVLRYYVTLVRQHVLSLPGLRLVGIYHVSETENYQDALDYLQREHIDWISLHPVQCAIKNDTVYTDNACREEFRSLVEHSQGLILNGGPDIPPSLYGRPTLLTTLIETPHRHMFEVSLLANLLGTARNRALQPLLANHRDYPVFGICVGMQTLNVAGGGTLIQDIPSELYGVHTLEEAEKADPNTWHRNHYNELDPEPDVAAGLFHPVRLTAEAPQALRNLLHGAPPQVLSIHHQAVDQLAPDYVVTATSLDGKVVEGIRHKIFPHVLGWQFHPERTWLWDGNEVARRQEGDPDRNFAYHTMVRDPDSKAFNAGIWQVFEQFVETNAARQAH